MRGETAAAPFLENQWVHVAVVLDPASRVLTTYLDGARAGQAADVAVNAAQIVHQTARAANRLFIGRSQDDAAPTLHARLRDVRIYRIALTDAQVATIRTQRARGTADDGAPRHAGPGDFDGRDPAGIAARVAVVARPRHHGRNHRRHAAAPAHRGCGELSRQQPWARTFA